MKHFCTYFDRNYLYRGVALYRSLERHAGPFRLHVLCFDEETHRILSGLGLSSMRLIRQEEFERGDGTLVAAKRNRTRVEYYWTCTPSLPRWVMASDAGIELVSYLDADLFFFSDPEPVFRELGTRSILLTEHRYAARLRHREALDGRFNVQFMAFRRDTEALRALEWWRDRCIEWCHNRPEDNKLGDQKYLDDWPERFHGVHVLEHRGAGLAPWNFSEARFSEEQGRVLVDGVPLIFYHFHQFRITGKRRYYYMSDFYLAGGKAPGLVYDPYVAAIENAIAEVRRSAPEFEAGIDSGLRFGLRIAARKYLPTAAKNAIKRALTPASLRSSASRSPKKP